MRNPKYILYLLLSLLPMMTMAQEDSLSGNHELREVVVKSKNGKANYRTENMELIGKAELFRAACCNLGESFVANPSVDVSYSDAATGAKQIKLLGLSGSYVQMLTENIPNLRGAAIPYSLGYVPGTWMQSIQVSKGASSVKNGYESITGQINIEFAKPQGTDGVRGNAYFDSNLKFEGNADASIHLTDKLSTSILLHYEDRQTDHDGNGDGFMDMPKQRQYNAMWRMAYVSPGWISQLAIQGLKDERQSGMSHHGDLQFTDLQFTDLNTSNTNNTTAHEHYGIEQATNRYTLMWKNGFTINADRNESVALMLHGSIHDAKNRFGYNQYDLTQTNGYAQLMYETDLGEHHNLATGASLNYDRNKGFKGSRSSRSSNSSRSFNSFNGASETLETFGTYETSETVTGIYAQYTYKLGDKFTAMAGLRYDYSSLWGNFVTPRLHLKYSPSSIITLRASAGKGYRTANAWAENVPLMASGRQFHSDDETDSGLGLFREEAWNYGISANLNIPVGEKTLELNAEYYYTNFLKQLVVSVDPEVGRGFPSRTTKAGLTSSNRAFHFGQLHGKSYSHTVQLDATYPFFEGFSATAAFRYNDARTTYEHIGLKQRPLTSKYKGLLTLSYKTPMELWQFDVTGQLNGPGHFYYLADSDLTTYPAYFQLQAQVTREFRLFSIYVGGENLTNYKIKNPIIGAANPWLPTFDATQVWGPIEGAMAYVGVRVRI